MFRTNGLTPGAHSGLSLEDREALASVLPGAELFYSEYAFFLHVASLFKSASLVCHDVYFSQLALSFGHPEADTADLWHGVIKGNIELGRYDDAYSSLVACPNDRLYVQMLTCRLTCAQIVLGQKARMCQRAGLSHVRRERRGQTDDIQFRWLC